MDRVVLLRIPQPRWPRRSCSVSGPKPPGPNHYELLRVAPTASREELRRAFRSLSKRYHPDTTELPASEAALAFRALRQAYAVLSDPLARRRYDGELGQVSLPPVPVAAMQAPAAAAPPTTRSIGRSEEVRRALSGGEWLALLLLALALLFSLVLGVGLALARGAAVVQWPSWWDGTGAPAAVAQPAAAAHRAASLPGSASAPPLAAPGPSPPTA
jgi:hypothetical protein